MRARAGEAKAVLVALPGERAARLAALRSIEKQREQFLDGFRLAKEKVPGIGPSRVATLSSFGIETAWDVDPYRIEAIPGFGPATAAKLIAWRQTKEARFRFNPSHPIAAAEINAIDAELGAKSHQAVSTLQTLATVLPRVAQEARTTIETSGPKLQEVWIAWKVAERHRRDGSLLGI